ncbi:MAG: hypothetical protein AAF593_12360 [Planctomycetota bacterium]
MKSCADWVRATALCGAAITYASTAHADDLFSITAVGGGTVTATGDSVLDLYEDAIETTGAFSSLSGNAIVATLNYAGVADSVRISVNAAGTSATLEFPGIGFTRVFAGTDADNLADQIEDFIQDDGAGVYAEFLEQINEQSVAAVLDGNPFSTTAINARHTFDLYGLGVSGPQWANPNRFSYEFESPEDDGTPSMVGWWEITPVAGGLSADEFDGFVGGIDVAGGLFVNEWLGFAAGGSFQYLNVEGTDIVHSVGHFAVPIKLVPLTDWDENPDDAWLNSFGWQLTPLVTFGSGGSLDAAAGGSFVGVGVASNLHLGYHDKIVLNWGSQIVTYEGIDASFDDFEFETELDQSIVSTGLLVTVFLDRPDGNVFLDGGVSYFTFLDDAAVDYWVSPEVGFGWRLGRDSRIRATYRPSFGNADYKAHVGGLNLVFAF